ncbi:MAG TPA: glycosyltransferase family 39 protein [Terriglobia bacterium]
MKRAIEAVFTVWLAVITLRYAETVLRSVAHPFNPGEDTLWLAGWLAAVSIIAACLLFWPGSARILVKLAIVAMIAIAVLSGAGVAALLALWFLFVAYIWGKWLLRLAGAEPEDGIESIALAVPLGLAVPAGCGFILACLHLLTPVSVWILVPGLTVLQWRTIAGLRSRTIEFRKPSFELIFPLLAALPAVVLSFVWAVAPEIHFDAANYHLAVPKIDLAAGGFIDQPYFFHSYFAHLVEMVFAFGIALDGQAAAKLLSFGLSLVAGCCAYSLGKEAFDVRVGCWAAAYFYTTPIVSWLSGTAYTDHIVAMFLTAAILAFVKWYKHPASTGWMYIAGVLAGMAAAAKINGAFGLPVLIVVVCWNIRRISVWRAAVFLALIAAVAAPWYAVTYYWTGNPVLPMLNGLFKSSMWEQANHIMNSSSFGTGTSPGSLIRLPFRFIFNTDLFGEASPRGGAGIALLIALPFSIVLLSRERRIVGVLAAAAAFYLVIWSFTFQYCRYFTHILPIVCILGAATVFHIGARGLAGKARLACLGLGLLMQFPATPVQFWNIPERYPLRVALGLETREHFLDRALAGYTAAQHLNAMAKPQDRVIGAGVEQVRFYLNAPLETLEESTLHTRLREVAGAPPNEALLANLRDYGFSYILATKEALQNPSGESPYLQPEFLSRFATVEFSDNRTVLYRL